ncbi:MAG: hypothetical protein E7496_12060 [Ruminococcus sp.]|nr:hypothetical protein [Ruminococcus sp.]
MKLAKKWLSVLYLGCTALLLTACSDNADENTAETETTSVPALLFETELATNAVSETSGTETTTSVSETTTEIVSTAEETTQTTTTMEETTTTTTSTTTEMPVVTTTVQTTTTVAVETAEATAPTPEAETATQKFEPGIWWSTSGDGDRYFCFYTGNNAGSFQDQESGLGMAFSYETDGDNTVIFHIGDAESSERVQVNFTDSSTAVLTWANGATETLAYQGLGNFDTFHFYSNLELCEMALDYYEAKYAYRPADASAEVQANGKIAIQLYDSLEDHNSTSAWYTVDRFTAQGTDIMGNTINLKS